MIDPILQILEQNGYVDAQGAQDIQDLAKTEAKSVRQTVIDQQILSEDDLLGCMAASLDTEGGQTGYSSQGSGGRISLAGGLSDADIATMAGGTLPDGPYVFLDGGATAAHMFFGWQRNDGPYVFRMAAQRRPICFLDGSTKAAACFRMADKPEKSEKSGKCLKS